MAHNLASGVIVVKEDKVLLVRDKYGWGLPKGSSENGETFKATAKRECLEETGYDLKVEEVAFITEYTSKEYGQYLQVYYSGKILSEMEIQDPDSDVFEIKFIPTNKLRDYITFRPWIIPLENWLNIRELNYYSFDLDQDGFEG